MVRVKDRAAERVALAQRGREGIFDGFGAHTASHRPASQLPASQIDHGDQVEVGAVGDGQVSDVADVTAARLAGAEVAGQQVGEAPAGLVRDRGAHASTQLDPRQLVLAHHPGKSVVVYPTLTVNSESYIKAIRFKFHTVHLTDYGVVDYNGNFGHALVMQ